MRRGYTRQWHSLNQTPEQDDKKMAQVKPLSAAVERVSLAGSIGR